MRANPGLKDAAPLAQELAGTNLLAVGWRFMLTRPRAKTKLAAIVLALVSAGFVLAQLTAFFVKARTQSARSACIANLKQIEGAKQTWALENKKLDSDLPTDGDLFGPTNYIRTKPQCPSGGIYTLGSVNQLPRCSLGITNESHTLEPMADRH